MLQLATAVRLRPIRFVDEPSGTNGRSRAHRVAPETASDSLRSVHHFDGLTHLDGQLPSFARGIYPRFRVRRAVNDPAEPNTRRLSR